MNKTRQDKTRMVFLAMAVAALWMGCGALEGTEVAKPEAPPPIEYTEDGRQLIPLSIGISGDGIDEATGQPAEEGKSEALFTGLAKGFNFVEVLFCDKGASITVTTKFYTKSARLPNTIKMSVPAGTYQSGNPIAANGGAVLLAGDYNNGYPILLALGVLNSSPVTIGPTTTSVPFKLYALKSDITANPTGSFAIPSIDRKGITIDSKKIPYWPVANNTAYTATTTLSFLTAADAAAQTLKGLDGGTATGIQSGYKLLFTGFFLPAVPGITETGLAGLDPASIVKDGTGTAFLTVAYATTKLTVTQKFKPDNTGSTGFASMYFNLPVRAFWATYDASDKPTANPDAVVWHLANGLDAPSVDTGVIDDALTGSTGAGILLGKNLGSSFDVGTNW